MFDLSDPFWACWWALMLICLVLTIATSRKW